MDETLHNFGLQPLKKDDRDFALGAIFDLGDPTTLPSHFELELPYPAKDQRGSDYCTAYASCGLSELQEGVELEPSFSFAMSKEVSGDISAWGQNLRDAMKAHVKYGGLDTAFSPYSLTNKDDAFLRDPASWNSALRELALPHRKKSFFKVQGRYNAFDDIRLALYKFREEKQAVEIGVEWGWDIREYQIKEKRSGFGHAVYAYGWSGDYLLIRNSYGSLAGKEGNHAIHKDIINEYADRFGAYMLVDIDKEQAKKWVAYGITESDNWFIRCIKYIKGFIL